MFFPQHNSHLCLPYLHFFNVTNSTQTISIKYAFNFLGRTLLYYTTFGILIYHNIHSMHMQRIATTTRSGGLSELKLERFSEAREDAYTRLMLPWLVKTSNLWGMQKDCSTKELWSLWTRIMNLKINLCEWCWTGDELVMSVDLVNSTAITLQLWHAQLSAGSVCYVASRQVWSKHLESKPVSH